MVIGAGAWGSALAQAAAIADHTVTLVGRSAGVANEINQTHRNSTYLGDVLLDDAILGSCDFSVLAKADLVILAVPAQATRGVLQGLPADLKRALPVIVTAKGFERQTLALQSDIVKTAWPGADILVLSGPSFAVDMVARKPIAVTLACENQRVLAKISALLSSKILRPYMSDDPKGVALCGGLKNIYAVGSGAIEGAGLGLSARSAFVARALAEMARIVERAGGGVNFRIWISGCR